MVLKESATSKKTMYDIPSCSWVPALSTDKVASVSPRHGVTTTFTHGVLSGSTTISPPRVKVSIVVALRASSGLTFLDGRRVVVALLKKVERSTHDPSDGRQGKKKRFE